MVDIQLVRRKVRRRPASKNPVTIVTNGSEVTRPIASRTVEDPPSMPDGKPTQAELRRMQTKETNKTAELREKRNCLDKEVQALTKQTRELQDALQRVEQHFQMYIRRRNVTELILRL